MALKVLVTYKMKAGHRDGFLADTAAARPLILAEDGCRQYDYFASYEDADKVALVEQWSTRDAQQIHLTQPHMAIVRKAKEDHVESMTLEMFDF